jgi:fibronectin type 3 domain-containing protein
LDATAAAGGVELVWTASADAPSAAGFDVLRRRAGEGSFEARVAELGRDRLRHLDVTAAVGDRYEYTVRTVAARDPLVESADGPVREIEYRDTFAPPTPTGLVALAEEGRIRLLWERVEAPDLAGYRLYRQAGGGAETELERAPGAGSDHSDDRVRAGVAYTYRVTAVDHDDNESARSEPATATPR